MRMRVHNFETKFKWNSFIRFYTELWLELAICAFINLRGGEYGKNYLETISMVFVYAFGAFFVAYFIFVFWILMIGDTDKRLGNYKTIRKYGSLYGDLKFYTHDALYTPIIFIVRRVLFAWTTLYFPFSFTVYRFLLFYLGTIFTVIYLIKV